MTHNPEKNAPIKINLERIKLGLSQRQMNKIKYECELLRKDVQELLYIAPHLFVEGTTASNTNIIEPEKEETPTEDFTPSEESQRTYGDIYSDYYDDMG